MYGFVVHGGWTLVPIACGLLGGIFLCTNGIACTSRRRIAPIGDEQTLRAFFRQGAYDDPDQFRLPNPSPRTHIVRPGLAQLERDPEASAAAASTALIREQL